MRAASFGAKWRRRRALPVLKWMVTLPSVIVRPGLITRSTVTSYCPARDDDALMDTACLLITEQETAFSTRCDAAKAVRGLRVAPGCSVVVAGNCRRRLRTGGVGTPPSLGAPFPPPSRPARSAPDVPALRAGRSSPAGLPERGSSRAPVPASAAAGRRPGGVLLTTKARGRSATDRGRVRDAAGPVAARGRPADPRRPPRTAAPPPGRKAS